MTKHEELVRLLATRSARLGEFTLASGARSNLYIDARMTAMSPEGLALIGPLGMAELADAGWKPDSVGGLTLGADPVSYAIAYASALAGAPIRAFTVRKEAKTHGTGKLIEGPFVPSDRVVVIEDVITTGGSADRGEGGRERIEAEGYGVRSLARASEIIAQMR
jgi:orotate phosphoribosyltransferase